MSASYAGIDVGATTLYCAAVADGGAVVDVAALPAGDADALRRWCAGATAIAIDAPDAPSTAPHAGDTTLAPKFRRSRCAEIELGRRHGSWVSWTTPAEPPFPGWMEAGFAAYDALRGAGAPVVIEVYPFAGFRALAGGRRLAKKQSTAGRLERADLLAGVGVSGAALSSRSHDELDALVAAVVARDRARGEAAGVTCGHDGSAIWLPATQPA
jgi:predicted nuclease with RNAse H fold